jgi:predicted TIM-barrel fold metal-dependent hydrolase
MGTYFSEREFAQVEPAEGAFRSPIPTQVISNGEFNPPAQTSQQKQVEARIKELADTYGKKLGMDRRRFLQTASGMAAAFVAMNNVFGKVFDVSEAEAADPMVAQARADGTKGQFIMDVQTHWVRDDYNQEGFIGFLKDVNQLEKSGLDPSKITVYDVKFENFVRQVYLNSDTSVAILSGAPFDDRSWEFVSNQAIADGVKMVNNTAGSTRLLGHAVLTPGQPGWMDEVDKTLAERPPASWKMYTIGDPLSAKTKYPFRLDDEKLMYRFYEKADKAGIRNICIHKGLMPADYEQSWANVWQYQTAWDLPKVAKDWPQLNFIIYHGCFRAFMDPPGAAMAEFEKTGDIKWVTELSRVPDKSGTQNVYAEMGTSFASTCVLDPKFAAAMLGTWIKGLGASNVLWGTDSVFHGSPQWQIEALRRLEIPEDMQKKYKFAPLGPANGRVKNQIFGLNSASMYNINLRASYPRFTEDKFAQIKKEYRTAGTLDSLRDNAAHGWIAKRSA